MRTHEQPRVWDTISFGPFRLCISKRLLLKDGGPVHLGGRALDILIALVRHAGQIVSKRELSDLVWPDITVDDGALRVQVASLRKVLNDGSSGARYVVTNWGRGYCFVAPVVRSDGPVLSAMDGPVHRDTTASLDAPLTKSD
ncbi:transcriptional regulator [Bradyrhizobium sp. 2TAF36]|uniref:winged helix-turn-helix domain-containing protein n=1 Tax=Bradyrhizobium sp. 2TAF36 TaxID=3233016 RepID=UPI003F914E28